MKSKNKPIKKLEILFLLAMCFVWVAEKKERNGTNKKSETRQYLNPGPRLVALMLYHSLVGGASAQQAEDMGSNPSECQILYFFCCVLSSLLPLRSVGAYNFGKGLHDLITLIKK